MYVEILKQPLKKNIQIDTLKNTIGESKLIQKCSDNSQEGRKKETEEWKIKKQKEKRLICQP